MVDEEVKWWREASRDDWAAFESLKRDLNFALSAFHLQQAAEKCLKAVSIKSGRPSFTHSCIDLCKRINSFGVKVPEEVLSAARRLDPHYIMGRYPNGVGGLPRDFYDAKLIEELEGCASTITRFADSKL